jgi:GWxTD domain-containing protein
VKKKFSFFVLILTVFLCLYGIAEKKAKDLPPLHKKWLEEEVVYIITPIEKEVFLKLATDRERDRFIDAFWKHRDPTPATPENEFRTEHFRRLNYANHFFGRESPKPGWKTDRGRMYILLGEPNDVQRFEGKTMTYPAEIWFYQGKIDLGLPPGFHLVFFQEGGSGEYRLYSPLKDGPQALLTSYSGDPMDYLEAYKQLKEFEPELAEVSLSLIPGEESSSMGRPSLASDLLVQKVETIPATQVKERYAKKFLEYKDMVEVEYTANYIDCDYLVKVLKDSSGMHFVHYGVEPERLSVSQYESKYYTSLKLNGKVSSLDGKTIYQFEKNISLDFDQERIKSASRQPLIIHDMFPLIPGNYKFSLLIKNEASKEFASLDQDILIPQDEQALQMTSLILGYRLNKNPAKQNKLRPFELGTNQVYFQPNRVFLRQDTLVLAFQAHGLSQEMKEKGSIKFIFLKGGQQFQSATKKLAECAELPNVIQQFSLQDFPPAHYRVQVSLLVDDKDVLFESDEFDITHLEAIPRPWVYSKILPEAADPVYSYIIGTQLFNSGRITEARAALEEANQKRPDSVDFALNLVQAYMALGEYPKIEPVLLPFLNRPEPPKYELLFIMGKAYQNREEFRKAIEVFDKAISHYGLNIHLLNSIGECYLRLNETNEALAAWQKSLELNPDQPQLKKIVEALKEKK